ncbi:putative camp-independent regulatory protein pac2 [Diaporthe ampelina]|uniref:Putative camp-independent regulatory protein pac2 n=1 Tax=Diaporthe ampelina TaxID=1214573 RepID=A0A0G2H8K8_9PEZI|nr:putative camp-independent regulatory protein pac2 [Diaporthe ampelina]
MAVRQNNMMETYHGLVRTPADAIKLFEACRLGLLPRVQRRLSEKERQSIRSGSVFVWDEREAGMRRWTDGKSWSASRVSGSFLTYREMEGKRGGGFGASRRSAGKTPDSGRGSDEDNDDGEPDGYRYKADGLMKQSFSITTSQGQHLHLISYFSRPHPSEPDLPQPSSDPSLRHIVPVKGMYPESSMNEQPVPAMTRTPMASAYAPAPPHPAAYHPH